jgi:hypothetical protein
MALLLWHIMKCNNNNALGPLRERKIQAQTGRTA